ncbi:MAG: hypothetical protein MZU97_10380 [Bacillus subtilis]|nr:hypothetical protein [Bacillus subtilis]
MISLFGRQYCRPSVQPEEEGDEEIVGRKTCVGSQASTPRPDQARTRRSAPDR